MKCPHCLVQVNPNFSTTPLRVDVEGAWAAETMVCPNSSCKRLIVELVRGEPVIDANKRLTGLQGLLTRELVKPFVSSRPPVPTEVDEHFAQDYKEACLIYNLSPKASAALSRRCLQSILREKAGVKRGDLAPEIQQVLDSGSLPTHLNASIDAIRNVGNFAAHPSKSTATGEIVDVEVGEAEWLLDVLEALFDFYFVQPAILQTKRDALNAKLIAIGKPPMK